MKAAAVDCRPHYRYRRFADEIRRRDSTYIVCVVCVTLSLYLHAPEKTYRFSRGFVGLTPAKLLEKVTDKVS